MATDDSVNLFLRLLQQKHSLLITTLDEFINSVVAEDSKDKVEKAALVVSKLSDLRDLLASSDQPAWIASFNAVFSAYVAKNYPSGKIMNFLIGNLALVKQHQWIFQNDSDKAFDFDAIYERYRSQSKIPELFDDIIKILEQIKSSGEVDSLLMMDALNKVISTLRRSKKGSYFSMDSAWQFFLAFFKNYMRAELSGVPVIGPMVDALEKTLLDGEGEFEKLRSDMQSEIKTMVEAELKGMRQKMNYSLTYDRTATKIESSSTTSLKEIV